MRVARNLLAFAACLSCSLVQAQTGAVSSGVDSGTVSGTKGGETGGGREAGAPGPSSGGSGTKPGNGTATGSSAPLKGAKPVRGEEARATGKVPERGEIGRLRSVAEIAEQTRPSLVKISQSGREGVYGVGSGFVLSADGLIVTNRHVIGEARRIQVETSDGRRHEVVEVYASDIPLDLAVLRVATKGLKPLELADSLKARQGDPIVAMGNPEGLAFSVVEGVISEPRREVEGQTMIQVAVPIERGNSGGPLLDRQGRVLGVLTLKSARTENLGFAMPTADLKKLLEKPNPIPMERWLTIGVLNPRSWKTLMGAQWTQRAGTINVAQPGDGFGGRSLCLWTEKIGSTDFDVALQVRLGDEAGAAGLAFCADGGVRHYGFYPTGGKLRLTRFDGADVFSWKILRELQSDAYKPGEWNALRVRVEGERIRCYVNETLVIELEDGEMRGGYAGLCKFRTTAANFKNFRLGGDVAEKPLLPGVESALRKSVDALLAGEQTRESVLGDLLKEPDSSRKLLAARVAAMEKEAALLREASQDLHRRAVRAELLGELEKPDTEADLFKCALLLSKHDNPELDVPGYERSFAQLVRELEGDPELRGPVPGAVRRLNRFLFEENGFHGSRSDFRNPSNSYINELLDDREGLPITLSVLYVELARRLGVPGVAGIPLPGRFMVGYREEGLEEYSIVDVYEGGQLLSMQQAVEAVSEDGAVPASARHPATKKEIIARMVRNLMNPLLNSRSMAKEALPYLDLILALEPDSGRDRLSRAMLREVAGDRRAAAEDVRWMLENVSDGLGEDRLRALQEWFERLTR